MKAAMVTARAPKQLDTVGNTDTRMAVAANGTSSISSTGALSGASSVDADVSPQLRMEECASQRVTFRCQYSSPCVLISAHTSPPPFSYM
jgi:hypothetical protein